VKRWLPAPFSCRRLPGGKHAIHWFLDEVGFRGGVICVTVFLYAVPGHWFC
jgi:hypothetical protein